MKLSRTNLQLFLALITTLAVSGGLTLTNVQASGGGSTTTKPALPVDDLGGSVKSGGGKAGSTTTVAPTPTPAPAPAPAPASTPITAASITYSAVGPINGVVPVCTGSYQISPYYPTLLDLTMNVQVKSMNVPDGTVLYVGVVGSSPLYPYTSNAIVITGGSGSCSEKLFIYPGTTVTGVLITDNSGTVLFAGN